MQQTTVFVQINSTVHCTVNAGSTESRTILKHTIEAISWNLQYYTSNKASIIFITHYLPRFGSEVIVPRWGLNLSKTITQLNKIFIIDLD